MTEKEFDILKIFEDTKVDLESTKNNCIGKIELLENLMEFFKTNHLKVVQETINETLDKDAIEDK